MYIFIQSTSPTALACTRSLFSLLPGIIIITILLPSGFSNVLCTLCCISQDIALRKIDYVLGLDPFQSQPNVAHKRVRTSYQTFVCSREPCAVQTRAAVMEFSLFKLMSRASLHVSIQNMKYCGPIYMFKKPRSEMVNMGQKPGSLPF